jgi:hypothetical protein
MKKELRALLSKNIQKEYNKLISIIADINRKDRLTQCIEGTGGLVSIADLIAYQIGWGTLLLTWYKAELKRKMPEMPGQGFDTWDYVGLAHHFYKKYHYDGYRKQEQKFHKIVQEIIDMVEHEYERNHLDAIGIWDWCTLKSGKKWPLSKWVQVNTVAPYKKAASLIKKVI